MKCLKNFIPKIQITPELVDMKTPSSVEVGWGREREKKNKNRDLKNWTVTWFYKVVGVTNCT